MLLAFVSCIYLWFYEITSVQAVVDTQVDVEVLICGVIYM